MLVYVIRPIPYQLGKPDCKCHGFMITVSRQHIKLAGESLHRGHARKIRLIDNVAVERPG